ncbi:hypothetical protein HU200_055074 [Digitaria exilis]|uniref:Uncharacterized protein n=1 Tax=Digitaria exilis TaxID=1010633 RepID=A0A835AJE6_9POAL|nr:hypothetical protein HU200_055074 [Digitaria exilis]
MLNVEDIDPAVVEELPPEIQREIQGRSAPPALIPNTWLHSDPTDSANPPTQRLETSSAQLGFGFDAKNPFKQQRRSGRKTIDGSSRGRGRGRGRGGRRPREASSDRLAVEVYIVGGCQATTIPYR